MRLLALAIASLALSGCVGGDSTASQGEPRTATGAGAPAPVRWRDGERGFGVAYPETWRRAPSRLTPYLGDPVEIVALGTYELRPGGDRCAHQPVNAVEDLDPRDALIVVFERAPPFPERGYPPRPDRPRLDSGTSRFCVPGTGRLDAWFSFGERGRAFYVLMALGEDASAETRRQLYDVYDSLVFDER